MGGEKGRGFCDREEGREAADKEGEEAEHVRRRRERWESSGCQTEMPLHRERICETAPLHRLAGDHDVSWSSEDLIHHRSRDCR